MSAHVHMQPAISPELAIETRRLTVAWLISVAALFGGTVAWIVIVEPPNAGWIWGQILGLAALPGKYVIFSGLIANAPLRPWEMAVLATITDIALALTLAVGLGWMAKVRWIAGPLKHMHDRAHEVLQTFPRLKRMAFWGVMLFVFLPLPASGAIGGTFLSQLVGLSRTSGVAAVALGGVLVSALFATLAMVMGKRAGDIVTNPWVTGISVAVFGAFVWWGWRRVRVVLGKR